MVKYISLLFICCFLSCKEDERLPVIKFPFITLEKWEVVVYKTILEEGMIYLTIQHDKEDNGLFMLDNILLK